MSGRILVAGLAVLLSLSYTACQHTREPIVFGTEIDASEQILASRDLAATATLKDIDTLRIPGDRHLAYYFPEAGKYLGFRVCTPPDWNGIDPLPLVMFLHGGWNDESSYLDENDRVLVKLAVKHGYLLVSPSGGDAAYGNNLVLPAEFGREEEARQVLANIKPERAAAQLISEKDVINVLEIVLRQFPVDRKRMFLTGHSMGGGGTWYIGGKYPDYWCALAPMSGPFVLEHGYPWKNLRRKPILITEGTLADASLESSRELRDWMRKKGFDIEYKEVCADHPGMVPLTLEDVFCFFDQHHSY